MNQHIPKDRTLNLAPERPRELCETILAALGRDDQLRRNCLRRRWQGLDDSHAGGACKLGTDTKRSEGPGVATRS
jgi:hypothetical protein